MLPLRKQFAKVRGELFNSGNQVVIRMINSLRMSYEESYVKAFPFDKMIPGMPYLEMIEDTAKIVTEAMTDKVRVNLSINNRAGGNAPLLRTLGRAVAGIRIVSAFLDVRAHVLHGPVFARDCCRLFRSYSGSLSAPLFCLSADRLSR